MTQLADEVEELWRAITEAGVSLTFPSTVRPHEAGISILAALRRPDQGKGVEVFDRQREVDWIAARLGESIASLGYPVGMGMAPREDQLKAAAMNLVDRWIGMTAAAIRALSASPVTEEQGAHPATYTFDQQAWEAGAGALYYFAPADAAPGPYLEQRHVEAIIDIDKHGRLAGVELIDNMPLPPLPRSSTGGSKK